MYDTLEKQLELEREMVDGGIERYRNSLNKSLEAGRESKTLHGRTITAHAIEAVVEGVEEAKVGKSNRDIVSKKLKGMSSEKIAFLSITSMIDTLSKDTAMTLVAKRIGNSLDMQQRLDEWIKIDKQVALSVIKLANEKGETARAVGLKHKMNKDGHGNLAWSTEEAIKVGARMISIIVERTGLIELRRIGIHKTKKQLYVSPTEKTQEWVKAFNEVAEFRKPKYAPTLITPKEWTSISGGGFYSDWLDISVVRYR